MKVVKDRASTSTLELAGAEGYAHLKKLIMLLKMGKPPVNIPPEKLFSAIGGKFEITFFLKYRKIIRQESTLKSVCCNLFQ